MAGLTQPLRDLEAWVRYFKPADVPVWDSTAAALEALRETEERVAPAQLAAVIEADPLLTLKFMADVATRWRRWGDDDAELPDSVLGALVMRGISPFFAHFGPQMTLQTWLQDQPAALEALEALHRRSERAGRFALAFAVHRADPDASLLALLARLQEVTEMLMWYHAPELMLRLVAARRADPTLRRAAAQRQVLNVELDALRQALLQRWRLPPLWARLSNPQQMEASAKVQSVVLAARLARHTTRDWESPLLANDMEQIATLLHAAPRVALAYVKKVDVV